MRDRTDPGSSGPGSSATPTPELGKRTRVEQALAPVQRRVAASGGATGEAEVHAAAARGTATAGTALPFADSIQRAFGDHDISAIQAHTGPEAAGSARDMGAGAYATGNHVVLGDRADLHTVAHEAAHVVQQRGGVQLKGGVGQAGDEHEHNADAVADRVVRGESAEDLLPRAGGASAPSVQRIVVDGGGKVLSDDEINQLKQRYPAQAAELDRAHLAPEEYVVTALRSGLTITPRAQPKKEWHYSMPEGHHASSGTGTTDDESRKHGMTPYLDRPAMPASLTGDIVASPPSGFSYGGSAALASGKGLKESGLARTHHLADSAIRNIVQYLHQNRGWMQSGQNFVRQWMSALCGPGGNGDALFDILYNARTSNELNAVVSGLSVNTWNVGVGSAQTNSYVVGPFFDESRTAGGIPSPVASVIAQYTQGLAQSGIVPSSIIQAALAQVTNNETGETRSSMTIESSPATLGPGVYDARNLTVPQLIDLIQRANERRTAWAVNLVEQHAANGQAAAAALQQTNQQIVVGVSGDILLRLRGG